jgi:hypothetical protein
MGMKIKVSDRCEVDLGDKSSSPVSIWIDGTVTEVPILGSMFDPSPQYKCGDTTIKIGSEGIPHEMGSRSTGRWTLSITVIASDGRRDRKWRAIRFGSGFDDGEWEMVPAPA